MLVWIGFGIICPGPALEAAEPPPLQRVLDEGELIRLTNAIDVAVDSKDWQQARRFFADDVLVDFTSLTGGKPATIKADDLILAWRTNLFPAKKTFHLRGNHLVTIDGDQATVTSHGYAWNQLSGLSGDLWEVWGTYTHAMARTPQGWRVTAMTFTKTYERGNPAVRTATPDDGPPPPIASSPATPAAEGSLHSGSRVPPPTDGLELVCAVPPTQGVTVAFIDALLLPSRRPDEVLFVSQNKGAQWWGGTPAMVWRTTFDPQTKAATRPVPIQSLSLIRQVRGALLEATDGTLFTGGGWCGHTPPYVSTDGGTTWQAATRGVHPPNSTFVYAEAHDRVYCGTGYNPNPGEVYRWRGGETGDQWERVFVNPQKARNILSAMVGWQGNLFVGTTIYESTAIEKSTPVYLSRDGQVFEPTQGIPDDVSVSDLVVVADQVVALAHSTRGGVPALFRWNQAASAWERIADYALQTGKDSFGTRLVAKGQTLYAYGRRQEDPDPGLYSSQDLGKTWARLATHVAPRPTALTVGRGFLWLATEADAQGTAYLFRLSVVP
ncbi:MAG: nuclear transport factor 2 family protein [Candidatus Riflebacteria bacterium]|nr:nuclear transport factor 2 family protein [Candidatus Riflebacteria bacterium]